MTDSIGNLSEMNRLAFEMIKDQQDRYKHLVTVIGKIEDDLADQEIYVGEYNFEEL